MTDQINFESAASVADYTGHATDRHSPLMFSLSCWRENQVTDDMVKRLVAALAR